MHSAVIPARHRYPALPLAGQPGHEGSLRPGPLVLRTTSLNTPTPIPDTDRTVSRRSEPSSCADRKSTRLNSSHSQISYAVFCLKKKKKPTSAPRHTLMIGHDSISLNLTLAHHP